MNVPDAVQPLCLDRCQERLYADDIHDAREIIGEHVQGHLGRNLRQALHTELIGDESAAPSEISKFNLVVNDFRHLPARN